MQIQSLGLEDPLEHGSVLQYSCLENPMDRGAWWATVPRVTKSWTQLKHLFNFYAEYIMRNKLESRLLREISITLDMQMKPPLWQKVKRN